MPHNVVCYNAGRNAISPYLLMPRFDAFAVFDFAKGQGSGFHFQIDFGIDVGRVQ
jgi:hypothetical protein